jgi:hypothetical protein
MKMEQAGGRPARGQLICLVRLANKLVWDEIRSLVKMPQHPPPRSLFLYLKQYNYKYNVRGGVAMTSATVHADP